MGFVAWLVGAGQLHIFFRLADCVSVFSGWLLCLAAGHWIGADCSFAHFAGVLGLGVAFLLFVLPSTFLLLLLHSLTPKNLRIQHLGKEFLLCLRFFRLFFFPGSLSSSLFPPCTSSSLRFPFLPLAPSLFLFASSVPQQLFASRISGKRRRKRAGGDSERANQGALVRRRDGERQGWRERAS